MGFVIKVRIDVNIYLLAMLKIMIVKIFKFIPLSLKLDFRQRQSNPVKTGMTSEP